MWQKLICGKVKQAVLKVDNIFIGVELILPYIIKVSKQML